MEEDPKLHSCVKNKRNQHIFVCLLLVIILLSMISFFGVNLLPSSGSYLLRPQEGKIVTRDEHEYLFSAFMQKFQKKYKSQKEYQRRLKIFKESLSRTKALRDSDTASYGITKFSDLTPGEFRKRMLADQNVQYLGDYNRTCGKYRHREEENNSDFDVKFGEIPLHFDWYNES